MYRLTSSRAAYAVTDLGHLTELHNEIACCEQAAYLNYRKLLRPLVSRLSRRSIASTIVYQKFARLLLQHISSACLREINPYWYCPPDRAEGDVQTSMTW